MWPPLRSTQPFDPRSESLSLGVSASSPYSEEEEHVFFPSYDHDDMQPFDDDQDQEEEEEEEEEEEVDECENMSALDLASPDPSTSNPLLYIPASTWPIERPEDDSAAMEQPTRHVDYLSHEWTVEDVYSSYKFVRAKRQLYPNNARLENAAWRTWEQKRRNLKRISPETVKW
jgi:hypothetical protein